MGNRLDEATGPFYDTDGVGTVLGVPEEAVERLREVGHVLALQTSDGVWVVSRVAVRRSSGGPGAAARHRGVPKPPWLVRCRVVRDSP